MVKITAEISKEMKITVEVIGRKYSETWFQKRPGVSKTKEKAIVEQMIEDGYGNEVFIEAVEGLDFHDVWESYLECN